MGVSRIFGEDCGFLRKYPEQMDPYAVGKESLNKIPCEKITISIMKDSNDNETTIMVMMR